MVLTERQLAAATDPRRFDHGTDYVRYVHGLRVEQNTAQATIQARRVYQTALAWTDHSVEGDCSCPDAANGFFCKHQVAVGLAVLEEQRVLPPTDALDEFVQSLAHDELVELLLHLVDHDQEVRALVMARAAAAGQAAALDPQDLVQMVNAALATGGFVDYRRSFDYARDVEGALDRLEELLDLGAADAVAPALLRATTRLRKVTLEADDSGGVIGGAGQRAVELYARACREGHADGPTLARWLVKFRRESPGWPVVELMDFAAAFDEKALAAYRRGVQRWADATPTDSPYGRFEVERALVELADHDGNLDAAIGLLSADPEHTQYGDIVQRLLAAGRVGEALDWLDRAIHAGRLSSTMTQTASDYWIHPRMAAELYLTAGRREAAVSVVRAGFSQAPGLAGWRLLIEVGRIVGHEDEQRVWGLAEAERLADRPYQSGAHLIEIALAEDRLDDAWTAAYRFGAGHAWEALVKASERTRPVDAARLYVPKIEELLRFPDTRKYVPAASMMASMKKLYATAGAAEEFARYLADIRERFGRRPSLMAAMAKRGL